jgi:[ribosomal protein S5]-alanine N-acetyltransferase
MTSPTTDEAYDRLLSRVKDERYEPMFVCRRDTGAIAGYINIGEIVRGSFQSAFLGYSAVAAYAGCGYMSEGLQLVLAHAFRDMGLHRLEANIQPGNAASIALVRRAGFVYEGTAERYLKIAGRWRDHEHWVIRSEQWRALRRRRS